MMFQDGTNQEVTKKELRAIRALDDFDIVMLISEIHDHGWPRGRKLLAMMPKAREILQAKTKGGVSEQL